MIPDASTATVGSTTLSLYEGNDVPLVGRLEITLSLPDGTVTYRGTFITSLPVNRDNITELAEHARTR